jgi:Zn-dependent metalloprotease
MQRGIIGPDLEEQIRQHAAEAQKLRAARSRAMTAKIRAKRPGTAGAYEPQAGEQRRVRDAEHRETEAGPIVRTEDSVDGADPAANALYDQSGAAFAYLWAVHGRQGWDGHLGTMESNVHYGADYDNAMWTGAVFDVGDGDIFPPFWKSEGVTYHELGHGFTQETCGLTYTNQPGGLNEGGSDILASLTEQWRKVQTAGEASWLIAPELFTEGLRGRGLRDMLRRGPAYDDPVLGVDPQIDDAEGYYAGMDPHVSSAVPNRWFAEACMQMPTRWSWETIGPIWYRAWTTGLTPTSGFAALAKATDAAATELFGLNSSERAATLFGWDAVKVAIPGGPVPGPTPSPIPDSPCALSDAEILFLVRHPLVAKAAARLVLTVSRLGKGGGPP